MSEIQIPARELPQGLTFGGILAGQGKPEFPRWLYKDGDEPRLVKNAAEDEVARADGYDNISAATTANKHLINWFWDFEDMSPRQLVVYAKEEYGVELPIQAGQEKLFQCVIELTRAAPQNQNRLVLMAHVLRMKYDATLEEIRRAVAHPAAEWEVETTTMEVWA